MIPHQGRQYFAIDCAAAFAAIGHCVDPHDENDRCQVNRRQPPFVAVAIETKFSVEHSVEHSVLIEC